MSSGAAAWPQTLRRKLGIPPSAAINDNTTTAALKSDDDCNEEWTSTYQSASSYATAMLQRNQQSKPSSSELRSYIHSSYAALTSIQRQLHRGEESYFEETYAHGNLFAGWDNIWIENPNSSTGGNNNASSLTLSSVTGANNNSNLGVNSGEHHHQPAVVKHFSTRKMPNEFRWFSSSCGVLADGKIAELGRASLIDRPPTPEVIDELKGGTVALVATDKSASADFTDMDLDVDDSITSSQQQQQQHIQTSDTASPSPCPPNEESNSKNEKEEFTKEDSKKCDTVQKDAQEDQSISDESASKNVDNAATVTSAPADHQTVEPVSKSSRDDNTAESHKNSDVDAAKDEKNKGAKENGDDDEEEEEDEEPPATCGVENEDVEMTPVDEIIQPPSKTLELAATAEQSSIPATEVSVTETKSDLITQVPTPSAKNEKQKQAKVSKISVGDTPRSRTATKGAIDGAAEEEKADDPMEKPANYENSETAENDEDVETSAKVQPKSKAPPARRTTRRTKKRKV